MKAIRWGLDGRSGVSQVSIGLRRHAVAVAVAVAVLATLALTSCGDDSSGADTTVDGPTTTAPPDRSEDRDRIRRSVTAMLEACTDQDRAELRAGMHDRMHDEMAGAMFRFHDQTHFDLMDEMMTFDPDGDGATVETRLRIREAGRAMVEAMVRWRFERSGSEWRSADLPPCLDGGPVPATGATTDPTVPDQGVGTTP